MCPTNSIRTRHSQGLWATHSAASGERGSLNYLVGQSVYPLPYGHDFRRIPVNRRIRIRRIRSPLRGERRRGGAFVSAALNARTRPT